MSLKLINKTLNKVAGLGLVLMVGLQLGAIAFLSSIKTDRLKINYSNHSEDWLRNIMYDVLGEFDQNRLSGLHLNSARIVLTSSPIEFFILAPLSQRPFSNSRPFAISYPLLSLVVLPPTMKDESVLEGGNGKTRGLTGVVVHELVHLALADSYGPLRERNMKHWAREGLADMISGESSYGFELAIEESCGGKNDRTNSFEYAQYRMLVEYLVKQEKWTLEELIDTRSDFSELFGRARTHYCS